MIKTDLVSSVVAMIMFTVYFQVGGSYGTYTVQKLIKGYITVVAGFLVASRKKGAKVIASWKVDACFHLGCSPLLTWTTIQMVHM